MLDTCLHMGCVLLHLQKWTYKKTGMTKVGWCVQQAAGRLVAASNPSRRKG